MRGCYKHLGEMRQTMLYDVDCTLSHISDMLDHSCPSLTTLRFACMVLIALRAWRLSEAMTYEVLFVLFVLRYVQKSL